MLSRRHFVLSALAVCLLSAAPTGARAQNERAAVDFVTNLANQTIGTMRAKDLSDAQRVARFRKLFVSSVDMPVIGKLVLARHWRTATPEQRERFLKLFEDVVVLTWSGRFKDVAGNVKLDVVGAKPDVDNGIQVESRIARETDAPVPLIWRLRPAGDSFKVVDLIAEGTSMVFTYREEYASVINKHGGKVDGLLDDLQTLVERLSAPQKAAKGG